jgi:hypothetical protein
MRPGTALHQRGIEAVVPPPDHLGVRHHRVAHDRQVLGELGARVIRRERHRVGQHRVRAGDLPEPERVRVDAAAVERGSQRPDGHAVRTSDGFAIRDMRRMVRLPVLARIPAAQSRQQQEHGVLARAHVADRPWLLTVTGQTRRRELVERRTLGAVAEERLAHARSPVDRLQGPDMEILTRVRAGEDGDLGGLEVERGDPAGLDEGKHAERLHGRAQRNDAIRVAELADDAAGDVGLDDVAAVDALLDPIPDVAGKDRRHDPAAAGGARRSVRGSASGRGGGCGHDRWDSGWARPGRRHGRRALVGGRGYPHGC